MSDALIVGDNVMIVATNRPWLDMTVPIESNDYQPVAIASIKIYGPCDELLMDDFMCEIPDRVGWYVYNYQTTSECNRKGLHKVCITFSCDYPACGGQTVCTTGSSGTSGSPATTGSSGSPTQMISNTKNATFRLLDCLGSP